LFSFLYFFLYCTPDAVAAIRKDLGRRKKDWLFIAAQGMADATTRDWKQWKSSTS